MNWIIIKLQLIFFKVITFLIGWKLKKPSSVDVIAKEIIKSGEINNIWSSEQGNIFNYTTIYFS